LGSDPLNGSGEIDLVLVKGAHIGDKHVRLVIRDNGPGFPDEVLKFGPKGKILTPKGSGLFLRMASLILERYYKASLDIENLPEGGARVTLSLKIHG